MASIDDYGDTSEPLNNPPLGGPSGWAKAVRDYLAVTVPGLFVAKTGDTMTGNLNVQKDGNYGPRMTLSDTTEEGVSFTLVGGVAGLYRNAAGAGITTTKEQLQVGDPLVAADAATKGYVDANYNANGVNSTTDLNTLEDPGLQPNLYGTSNPNTPESGNYFMVLNFVYNNTEITQFAIPYANVAGSANVYMRGRYQGSWTGWQAWK